MIKYNQKQLKKKFYKDLKDSRLIDVYSLAKKYDVNLLYVKSFLRDQIAQGLLRGELKNDVFHVDLTFQVEKSIKEKRLDFLKENLGRYVESFRSVKIRQISNNFKVPNSIITSIMMKMINDGILKGYFEGDTFIRDIHSSTLECPSCGKKIEL